MSTTADDEAWREEEEMQVGDCECDNYEPLEFPDPEFKCDCGALTLEACICKEAVEDLEELLRECDCGKVDCTCNRPEIENEFCYCCLLPSFRCKCGDASTEAKEELPADLPEVLEADHPLMKRFQDALQKYLERELQIASEEILGLKDELKNKRTDYEKDLEAIYMKDHDANQQRKLIEQYENEVKKMTQERQEREASVKASLKENKKVHDQLEQELHNEREARRELRALESLVCQLETWRKDTEEDLGVRQRVSEKISLERKQLAKEKRDLDLAIFKLNTETWRLEADLELAKKQATIKSEEIEQVRDRSAELDGEIEDTASEKKRLITLWNSVLVNISRRDKIHAAVRSHYQEMEENHLTLVASLEGMKKEEASLMKQSQEAAMACDKFEYDTEAAFKIVEIEEKRMEELLKKIEELEEFIALNEKDEELIKGENSVVSKKLGTVNREVTRRSEVKAKIEDTALTLLEQRVRGDHRAKALLKAITVLKGKTRKQEITLMMIENTHAKMMLDIELYKSRQLKLKSQNKDMDEQVLAAEKKITEIQIEIDHARKAIIRRQRCNDIKKAELMEAMKKRKECDKQIDINELENERAAEALRCETLVADWLRLQGHVVRLSGRHERLADAMRLREQQVQIMEQRKAALRLERKRSEEVAATAARTGADLRSKLEWLQGECKRLGGLNECIGRDNAVATIELSAKLKEGEAEIIQLEDDIVAAEADKKRLGEELDAARRNALVWHRKCAQALEIKKKIQASKSDSSGEINVMKSEIHKMQIRENQLRLAAEKLSKELAIAADRRGVVAEKARASVAGLRPPPPHRIRLRLLRAARDQLLKDKAQIEEELSAVMAEYDKQLKSWEHYESIVLQLEEDIKELEKTANEEMLNKQFLLEKLVRQQRLASEIDKIVKRGAIKLKRPENMTKMEFERSRDSVQELRTIVQQIMKEKPTMDYKLQFVLNSLTVEPQDTSPNDSLSSISTRTRTTN